MSILVLKNKIFIIIFILWDIYLHDILIIIIIIIISKKDRKKITNKIRKK